LQVRSEGGKKEKGEHDRKWYRKGKQRMKNGKKRIKGKGG